MLRPLILIILLACASTLVAADGPKIGVLYLENVFKNSKLVRARSGQLLTEIQETKAAIAAVKEEVDQAKAELDVIPQDHPRFAEKRERFEVAKLKYKLFLERMQVEANKKEAELLKSSYGEVKRLLADYAKEKAFTLILLMPDPTIKSNRVTELRLELSQHTVLFHEPQLDITKEFIAFADKRFDDTEAPASGTGPAFDPAAPKVGDGDQ